MATNIYKKIMSLRNDIKEMEIRKSGHNTFQHFRYLELSDFIPQTIELCNKYGLYTQIDIGTYEAGKNYATMTVINMDCPDEYTTYKIAIPEISNMEYNGKLKAMAEKSATTQIQDMGKLETYCRRYLYMLFLDLAVPDTVDNGKPKNNLNFKKNTSNFNNSNNKSFDKGYEEQVMEDRRRPRPNNDVQVEDPEPLQTIYNKLVNELESEGSPVTKSNLRVKATGLKRENTITAHELKEVIAFINNTEGLEP